MKKTLIIFLLVLFLSACGDEQLPEKDIQPELPPPVSSENESTENEELDKEQEEKTEEIQEAEIILPNTELQKLDEGEEVQNLQQALVGIGYSIPIDGVYSDLTVWAVTDFQLQSEDLYVTGVFDEDTKLAIEKVLKDEVTVEAGKALPPPDEPAFTGSGSVVVTNPYEQLVMINKEHALPENFEPHDLIVPNVPFPFKEDDPKKQLRAPAAKALEELFQAAEEAGHNLFAQSGYRSYSRQVFLFDSYSQKHGEEEANKFSARPGESEHQTGLTMDITSEAVGYQLTVDFGNTPEGKWVAENAHKFGFIIRYPEGKEDITKYQYEPWHLRYVGIRAATEIKENDLTLEEYLLEQ